MEETYVECLVKQKTPDKQRGLLLVVLVLSILFFVLTLFHPLAFLVGAVLMGVFQFMKSGSDLEYEYLYLDKEISIDKVVAKTRRKHVAVYTLEGMEIFAPLRSYHLDNYKNRQVKTVDYSSGVEQQPEQRYVMYYEGGLKVILEPSPQMVKAMKMAAPRKVFTD